MRDEVIFGEGEVRMEERGLGKLSFARTALCTDPGRKRERGKKATE